MKQPVAANVIEFPSSTMAKMSNILVAFAIAFLASLSLSSAFTEHNLDIPDTFERHLDYELQPLLREKREKEAEVFQLGNDNSLELEEELPEPKSINERGAIGEEAKDGGKNEESEKPITESKRSIEEKETAEENAQDDEFSYRTMHDLIKTLIEADKEDITEKLQQLREAKNAPESEKLSNLPKRQAAASAAAAASSSSGLLGVNPWDVIPLDDLDAHSCESEAFSHGHSHVSGTLVHEFGCELRKSWHYGRLVLRNLNSGLSLGPLIGGGEIVSGGLFNQFCDRASHLFHVVVREPHHLLILPDIIRDAVPCDSIIGAFNRLKHVFFRVLHFGLDLCHGHVRPIFGHLFSQRHHLHLKEKLHHHLHHLHHSQQFGSILPLEGIVAEPVVSTSAAAAATATATAAASSDSSVLVPDYHTSLAEVLSSFRGFYDGYHASGIPHLIRTGTGGISVSSAFSRIGSYLSGLPFFSQFGCGPVGQSTTVTTTSAASASSSVGIGGGPAISPIIEPTIVPAPIISTQAEPVSSSASATAITTTTVVDPQPVFSAGPTIVPSAIPYESSFAGETATAAAAATATAAAASPAISGYPTASLIPPVPTLSPEFVPVAVPEVVGPSVLEDNVVTAAAAAAASSFSDVVSTPIVGRVPHIRPLHKHKHKARPVLSTGAPGLATAAAAAAASSVADVVSTPIVGRVPHIRPLHKHRPGPVLYGPDQYRGFDLDIDRRIGYPLNRLPAAIPSSAASSAAAASTATASAAASSSASSSDGFNFALPRQHIVDALGYDYLLPGDIITVTLRNKSTLFGRVLDATSPITFDFLRPKMRTSLLRHGGRLWNLLPRDFRDPECYRKFNDPLLLRHGF